MAVETYAGRAERAAQNQALCREVNERIESLHDNLHIQSTFRDFICECALPQCSEPIHLTVPEYESVRADANLFVISPSEAHILPDVEDVIDRFDRYWTVKKRGKAAEVAVKLDPRARSKT